MFPLKNLARKLHRPDFSGQYEIAWGQQKFQSQKGHAENYQISQHSTYLLAWHMFRAIWFQCAGCPTGNTIFEGVVFEALLLQLLSLLENSHSYHNKSFLCLTNTLHQRTLISPCFCKANFPSGVLPMNPIVSMATGHKLGSAPSTSLKIIIANPWNRSQISLGWMYATLPKNLIKPVTNQKISKPSIYKV